MHVPDLFDLHSICIVDLVDLFCIYLQVYAEGNFTDKLNFLFDFFDFDGEKSLSLDEVTFLIMSAVRGMTRLAGIPLVIDQDYIRDMERTARQAFLEMDTKRKGSISKQVRHRM